MKWVKSSDKLPEEGGLYFFKNPNGESGTTNYDPWDENNNGLDDDDFWLDESPTQSQVGNTTQGEQELYTKTQMREAFAEGWDNSYRHHLHKEGNKSLHLDWSKYTPTTQSEGEERLYTMEEVHQFTRESIEYLTAKSSLFQELQALRLSNSKLVEALEHVINVAKSRLEDIAWRNVTSKANQALSSLTSSKPE